MTVEIFAVVVNTCFMGSTTMLTQPKVSMRGNFVDLFSVFQLGEEMHHHWSQEHAHARVNHSKHARILGW